MRNIGCNRYSSLSVRSPLRLISDRSNNRTFRNTASSRLQATRRFLRRIRTASALKADSLVDPLAARVRSPVHLVGLECLGRMGLHNGIPQVRDSISHRVHFRPQCPSVLQDSRIRTSRHHQASRVLLQLAHLVGKMRRHLHSLMLLKQTVPPNPLSPRLLTNLPELLLRLQLRSNPHHLLLNQNQMSPLRLRLPHSQANL